MKYHQWNVAEQNSENGKVLNRFVIATSVLITAVKTFIVQTTEDIFSTAPRQIKTLRAKSNKNFVNCSTKYSRFNYCSIYAILKSKLQRWHVVKVVKGVFTCPIFESKFEVAWIFKSQFVGIMTKLSWEVFSNVCIAQRLCSCAA